MIQADSFLQSGTEYNDIKRRLRDRVASGEWKPGELIPAAEHLGVRFGVPSAVLHQAINELVTEKQLVRDSADLIRVAALDDDRPAVGSPAAAARPSLLAPWYPSAIRKSWPGMSIAIVIALAASFVAANFGGPQLLYALFFGLAFHFLSKDPTCRPGIEFCSKTLLRTGVALLGARITFEQIVTLGIAPIAVVVTGLLATIGVGLALAKWLKRPVTEGLLSGGAVAICGASAALAISATLPQNKDNEKFTLLTVVGVTTLSTVAMIVYPLLVKLIGLDSTAAGIFLGGSIHDVAQVVGAGYLISPHTGDVATLVKLTRVACLVPIVLILCIVFQSRSGTTEVNTQPLVPFFLIGFIWLMLANSFGFVPAIAAEWFNMASRACLVVAIAALGMKTSFQSLASLGWTPVFMLVAETVWLALFMLVAMAVMG